MSTNFLNWIFPNSRSFPVSARIVQGSDRSRAMDLADGNVDMREWVALEDGPQVRARVGGTVFELELATRKGLRELRGYIRDAPTPWVAMLTLSRSDDDLLGGHLTLCGSVLPSTLREQLTIVVSDEILELMPWKNRDILREAMSLPLPTKSPARAMVIASTILLHPSEHRVKEVEILFKDGGALTCEIEEVEDGASEVLVAQRFDPKRCSTLRAPAVRFIGLVVDPVISSDAPASGIALELLYPLKSPHLSAWMAYEAMELELERERFDRIREHEPEYGEVIGTRRGENGATIVRVRPREPNKLIEAWCDKDRGDLKKKKAIALNIPVQLESLEEKPRTVEKVKASRLHLDRDGKYELELVLAAQEELFPKGRLRVVEDRGSAAAHHRRKSALEMLESGQGAIPELIEYFVDPSRIPEIRSKDRTYWRRKGAPMLDDNQRKVLVRAAREPTMLLVQGPPGTGKTTVITEIIHQLRHRHRNDSYEEEDSRKGPLKVLVSSVQNEAVNNATDKLSGGGVLVDVYTSTRDSKREHESIKNVTGEIRQELEQRPSYNKVVGLKKALDDVRALRAALSWRSQETISRLEHFEQEHGHITSVTNNSPPGQALQELLAEENEEHAEDPYRVSISHDVRGVLERILALPEDPQAAIGEEVISLLDVASDLLSSHDDPDDPLSILVDDLDAARSALNDAHRFERKWKRLREETSLVIKEGDTVIESKELSPLDMWEDVANAWFTGTLAHIEGCLGVRGYADILAMLDFVEAMERSPTLYKQMVDVHAPVVATTCQKSSDYQDHVYDVAIIDEAARGGIDVLISMLKARSIILIGDHHQLPPHIEREIERKLDEELRREVDLKSTSIFSFLWEKLGGSRLSSNCISLTRQYRMHRDIGEIVSSVFYEPEIVLEHDCPGGANAERAPRWSLFKDTPFVWVDTSEAMREQPSSSKEHEVNEHEVEVILQILRRLEGECSDFSAGPIVGLIPFYGAQVKKLKERLQESPELWRLVELGTVDSFQGKDYPIVIASAVKSNLGGHVGFLKLPNRINVAISRAKNQFILVGDSATLAHPSPGCGGDSFKKIKTILEGDSSSGRLVSSQEVLRG